MNDDVKTILIPVPVHDKDKSPLWEGVKDGLLIGATSAISFSVGYALTGKGKSWK